jgi:eukaryotic-like serine/threonine-protein kinase
MTNRAARSWTVPSPGDTVGGKYRIEAQCGRGGLAVVYSAVHEELDRRVAIKVLLPEWAGDAEVVERFVREGRTATRVKSEHCVRIFDVGRLESGAPYLVLEFLEGHNLEQVVDNWGAIAPPTAIDWVLQAAEAIGEAHSLGVIHRDIKPANLFLTRRPDGSASIKVIDFGLSKLSERERQPGRDGKITLPTDVMGSPHYMAPEQLRGARGSDERVDIWALGAVLYELVTGRPPFAGETVPEICASVLTQPVPPMSVHRPNIPPGLERVVARCLAKDPGARFGRIAELAYAAAPFGTADARASYERISRVGIVHGAHPSDITPLPPMLPADAPSTEPALSSWPTVADEAPSDPDLYYRRLRASGLQGRVLLGSFLMLAGLGAGAFLLMYESVHGTTHASTRTNATGVTAPQPTTDRASLAAPLPGLSTQPAPVAAPVAAPPIPPLPAPPVEPAGPSATPSIVLTPPPAPVLLPSAHANAAPAPAPTVAPAPSPAPLPSPAPAAAPAPAPKVLHATLAPARPSTPPPARPKRKPAGDSVLVVPSGPIPAPSTPPAIPPGDDLFDGRK